MNKFDWNHPAITNYIHACKSMKSYWNTMTKDNLINEANYLSALDNVRKYLDDLGYKMPHLHYEDKRIEKLMFTKY